MFVLVMFFQLRLGASAFGAGLMMLPWSGGLAVGSLLAGMVLVPRFGARVMRAGIVAVIAGLAATAALIDEPGWLVLPLAVAGTGLAMFTVPFFGTALSSVDDHETGSASGLLNAVQQ